MLVSTEVQLIWGCRNRKKYEEKGYKFTKYGDLFTVKIEDIDGSSPRCYVDVSCDYCGKVYQMQYANYVRSKKTGIISCEDCKALKIVQVTRDHYAPKMIAKARQCCDDHGLILLTTEDEYVNTGMDIVYECPKHGIGTMPINSLVHGHGCWWCAVEAKGKKLSHSGEYVYNLIRENGGNTLLNPDDYKAYRVTNLKIRCHCGNVYTTSLLAYLNGNKQCRSCSSKESQGEKKIREYLEYHSINYVPEKRFDDCKDIRSLPFDFYLPDYNLIIEFDGAQHYRAAFGEAPYDSTVRHDQIKTKYCLDNNIHLLRIPYWDFDNIYELIEQKLNEIGKKDIV